MEVLKTVKVKVLKIVKVKVLKIVKMEVLIIVKVKLKPWKVLIRVVHEGEQLLHLGEV